VRVIVWPSGRTFTRAHPHLFGSTAFDVRPAGSTEARFSPLQLAGRVVPVLYGGVDDRTATAETISHLLPTGGRPRWIRRSDYTTWQWSTVYPTRDLRLLALDATYPAAAALVDGTAPSYHGSRDAAAQLLASHPDIDGLVWPSRQLHDRPSGVTIDLDAMAVSLVLFGPTGGHTGGVQRHELASTDPSVLFLSTEGMRRLMRVGSELDATVVIA
jgi:hypothetical protein